MLTTCCALLGLAGASAAGAATSAFEVEPVALVQLDADWTTTRTGQDRHHAHALGIGRAELGLRLTAGEHFDAVLGYELHEEDWLDARLRWRFGPDARHRVLLGQFKQFHVLEELESTRDELFVRGTPVNDAFALSRRVGVGYVYSGARWHVAAARFHRALDADQASARGHVLRAVWLPWRTREGALHVGASLARQDATGERAAERTSGLEAAWLQRSLRVQGEWLHTQSTQGGGSLRRGHSVSALWNVTGEHWSHEDGQPVTPEPHDPVRGMWQLGVRHASLAPHTTGPDAAADTDHWAISASGQWARHWKVVVQHEWLRTQAAADMQRDRTTTVRMQWHW